MATTTKKELVDRIAERTGQRRTVVREVLQRFLDEVVSELGHENRLEFRDFGVFEVKQRAARTAQNPKTLEPVPVPPKHTVKFKPGRQMRDAMQSLDDAARSGGESRGGERSGQAGSGAEIKVRPHGRVSVDGTRLE